MLVDDVQFDGMADYPIDASRDVAHVDIFTSYSDAIDAFDAMSHDAQHHCSIRTMMPMGHEEAREENK